MGLFGHSQPVRTLKATAGIAAALVSPALAALPGKVAAEHPGLAHAPLTVLGGDDSAPVLLAAGDGHAVAMRQGEARSELLEVGLGQEPRVIRSFAGGLAMPSVGTDAAGRPVVVVRGCAPHDENERGGTCSLSVVDVASGRTTALPGSKGASLGDLDRGRAVIVRQPDEAAATDISPTVTLQRPGGAPATELSIDAAIRDATGGENDDAGGSQLEAIDLQHGQLAATVRTWTAVGGASALIGYGPGSADWALLAGSRFGEGGIGPRLFSGPQVTPTGIRAFYDGAGDMGGYAGRWSAGGGLLEKITGGTFGDPQLVGSTAFDGDTLLARSGASCDDNPLLCGVLAMGPVQLG